MTDEQKKTLIKNMIGDNNADVTVCLTIAESEVLNRLYPFGRPTDAVVPTQYEVLECKLASRIYFRNGGEGEIMHTENGVSRTYASVNDEDILSQLTPFAKVMDNETT